MCIKKGRDISLPFWGGREREEAAAAPHELLTGAAPIGASVWMHVFCSYSCSLREIQVRIFSMGGCHPDFFPAAKRSLEFLCSYMNSLPTSGSAGFGADEETSG